MQYSTYNYLSRGNSMLENKIHAEEVETVHDSESNELTKPPHTTIRNKNGWRECERRYRMPMYRILKKLYCDKGMTVRNGIDKKLGFSARTIYNWIRCVGIPARTPSEENKLRYSKMTVEQRKALTSAANEHVRKHGQPSNIGKLPWCAGLTKHDHPGLMSNSIKHLGKNNPMANMRGALNPKWTGGEKYWKHQDWFEIRETARKRDKYRCMDCGITEEEYLMLSGQPLQVHHIIPYRICKTHELDNLTTLCARCHAKADGNLVGGEAWKQKQLQKSKESNRKQCTISQF